MPVFEQDSTDIINHDDIGMMELGAHFGLVKPLGVGEISDDDWFENAKALGLHYGAEFGYQLGRSWQIVAGIDAHSYALDFNPVDPATAQRVAGGASDRYLSFYGGLRWYLTKGEETQASASSSDAESDDDFGFD